MLSRTFQLHSDLDKGDNLVKYTLSGEGVGSIFTVEPTTGDIHALRSLDREEKPYYTLRAQAVDVLTGRPLEPESEFIIKVQDINDNEHKFLEGPYSASVPEMSPIGKRERPPAVGGEGDNVGKLSKLHLMNVR